MVSLNKYPTHQPSLEELAGLFNEKLRSYFENVNVNVVDCPDLTQSPFNLVGKGLCSESASKQKVLDVGGENFLIPLPRLEKSAYDIVQISKDSGFPNRAHIVGAACGPFKTIGYNSELIPNVAFENDKILNGTKCSYLPKRNSNEEPEYIIKNSPNTCFNILGNFYVSEGLGGKVLKVNASRRKNEDKNQIDLNGKKINYFLFLKIVNKFESLQNLGNLISVMRKILNENYSPERPVSIGGVFLYRGGKAKLHIMPEFSKVPLQSPSDVKNWLKFYDFNAPLLCLTAFHTHNNFNLGLREEHTHCFGIENNVAGGHYHYELDAANANYEGYFNVAGEIVRVDQP